MSKELNIIDRVYGEFTGFQYSEGEQEAVTNYQERLKAEISKVQRIDEIDYINPDSNLYRDLREAGIETIYDLVECDNLLTIMSIGDMYRIEKSTPFSFLHKYNVVHINSIKIVDSADDYNYLEKAEVYENYKVGVKAIGFGEVTKIVKNNHTGEILVKFESHGEQFVKVLFRKHLKFD